MQMDSPYRILLVEDFDDLRKAVSLYLTTRGYHVLEAANGRAAVQIAIDENPDLILLDLRLPDITGLDVARELHKLLKTNHIPIVSWSGDSGSNPQREVLRQVGINYYLEKPIRPKDLDTAIEQFLPKSKQQH